MAKKRKSDSSRLDEVDRSMYTSFCTAANSLSQLYTQAMNQQRLAFQAGERNAMEKLYNWILRQQEGGIRLTSADIAAYLQHELDYFPEEPPASPHLPFHQQLSQNVTPHTAHSGIPASSVNTFGSSASLGHGAPRTGNVDQIKNSVFSNALSSPVRRSLQHCHSSQNAQHPKNGMRSSENNVNLTSRDPNLPSSNDTSMDMHPDSPGHDSPY